MTYTEQHDICFCHGYHTVALLLLLYTLVIYITTLLRRYRHIATEVSPVSWSVRDRLVDLWW